MLLRQKSRGFIPFIILTIVAVFMILLVIGFFTENRPFGLPNFKKTLHLSCGLNLYNPEKNEDITLPYTISGYANGCGWDPDAVGSLGKVSILASNGLILKTYSLTTNDLESGKPYYFEIIADLPVTFYDEDGVFVFENNGLGFAHERVQVPIHFK